MYTNALGQVGGSVGKGIVAFPGGGSVPAGVGGGAIGGWANAQGAIGDFATNALGPKLGGAAAAYGINAISQASGGVLPGTQKGGPGTPTPAGPQGGGVWNPDDHLFGGAQNGPYGPYMSLTGGNYNPGYGGGYNQYGDQYRPPTYGPNGVSGTDSQGSYNVPLDNNQGGAPQQPIGGQATGQNSNVGTPEWWGGMVGEDYSKNHDQSTGTGVKWEDALQAGVNIFNEEQQPTWGQNFSSQLPDWDLNDLVSSGKLDDYARQIGIPAAIIYKGMRESKP
jgi:hypothetical protein